MTNKILMGASVLAILISLPAFAETKAKAEVSTETKVENALDKAGNTIEKTADKAVAATKEGYADVKAYFSDDKNIETVTSVNVMSRLTADEVIGATVQNPAGETIGKVEDILVNKEGDAERVIISDGGVLGLGGKLASFDYDLIEGMTPDQDIVVKLTEKSIKDAKGFEYEPSKTPDPKVAAMPADMFSVNKIIGSKVVDSKGKAVAKVDTVAFDDDDADYLIVTFNKIMGMGGDTAALDFEALEMTNNKGKYTFKLNAQQAAQFQNYKATTKAN